jgi:AcrR family transcriptional regulator
MKKDQMKRGRPSRDQKGLSKESIINVSKNMMQLSRKVPSIRAIATEMNVDAMALYYYFKNKDELLEGVTVSLISEIYEPVGTMGWQAELLELAKSYLSILFQYDGLLQTFLSMTSNGPANVFINRFNKIMLPVKLEESNQTLFLHLFVDYLHGFSLALANDKTRKLRIEDAELPLGFLFKSIDLERHQKSD